MHVWRSLQSPPWSNDLAILTFAANTFDAWYEPDFRENILALDILILGAGYKGTAVNQPWVYDKVLNSQGVVRWGTNEVESIDRTQGPGWGEIFERFSFGMNEDTNHESGCLEMDSGGPSLIYDSGYKVIGVHQLGGAGQHPAGFTDGGGADIRICIYQDWIESFIGGDSNQGHFLALARRICAKSYR